MPCSAATARSSSRVGTGAGRRTADSVRRAPPGGPRHQLGGGVLAGSGTMPARTSSRTTRSAATSNTTPLVSAPSTWVTTQSAQAVVCCITQSSQEMTMRPIMTRGCRSETAPSGRDPSSVGRGVNSAEGTGPRGGTMAPMGKRALCVGVNKYPRPDLELRGCVNDAKAWATLLRDHYDFAPTDVKLLTDRQATKAKIVQGARRPARRRRSAATCSCSRTPRTARTAPTRTATSRCTTRRCARTTATTDLLIDDELRELFAGDPRRRPPDRDLRLLPLRLGHPRSRRRDAGPPAQAVARPEGHRPARHQRRPPERPSRGPPTCTRSRACASCCSAGAAPTSTATTPASAASSTAR